ncbi:asparagine synthase (glutamine-hydrolyzing) [Pseudomonas sp.]|uniref:asparagine synthase (glutamine-hydrolyzing) n=1 Tax=Pseudomonas sp. TaxID=306 RepID=UPI003D13BB02
MSALTAMRRRGPDDQGYEIYDAVNGFLGLGHTRLSIIDLSAAGHQPMQSQDDILSIVFNGEIYNYRELRMELEPLGHHFVSGSDTEVLLAAWRQWGRACLSRLVGMFAFAVFDRMAATLTCVRDAFGIKPFFYTQERGNFLFASEVSAIKALKQERVRLDWQRAHDYLVHADYDSGARTFFEGVLHLPPGHLIELDLASFSLGEPERWWAPTIDERSDLSFVQATEQVRERFLESVRLHLRSDVPLGAALSGGIDSSAVVCAMRHIEPDLPINTFSYIAQGSSVSEEVWVDLVNQYVGAQPHKITVGGTELVRDLDDMIIAQGEPFGSTSIYAQYRVFQLAREHGVTVTLDGQGADELLAGYNGYPGHRLHSLIDKGKWRQAWAFLNAWAEWPGRSRISGIKHAVAHMTSGTLHDLLRRSGGANHAASWINSSVLREQGVSCGFPHALPLHKAPGRRVMEELATSLTQRGLPALLRHGDRNSMRFSVESRVPFLTTDMADLLLSLPEHYLISDRGETKHVFRAAMRGIVPDEILNRRDKVGFETPEHAWLRSMPETIREWLRVDLQLPFLHQSQVIREFDLIMAGKKPFSWQVWRWVNFCRWYKLVML